MIIGVGLFHLKLMCIWHGLSLALEEWYHDVMKASSVFSLGMCRTSKTGTKVLPKYHNTPLILIHVHYDVVCMMVM